MQLLQVIEFHHLYDGEGLYETNLSGILDVIHTGWEYCVLCTNRRERLEALDFDCSIFGV